MTLQRETDLFKALGDPLRLRIMALLLNGERCVCDLVATLNANQSTVSRHLSTLRKANLVQARREGTWMHYSINPSLPEWVRPLLDSLRQLATTHPVLKGDAARLNAVPCPLGRQ